jgi:alpha-L-fucosidase
VGKGGNFLLNVGPQPDGQLPDAAVQRMNEMGDWMRVNGEAIYGTRPIAPYKEGNVVFTRKGRNAYAIYLTAKEGEGMPANIVFSGLRPVPGSKVKLLGVKKTLSWQTDAAGLTTVAVPASIVKSPPCQHAFVLRFELSGQEK